MADIRLDDIKKAMGEALAPLQADITGLKEEQQRQGVLLEDMDSDLKTALENLSTNLKVKRQVDDHEERLASVEANQDMLKSTVKLHSRQLKAV